MDPAISAAKYLAANMAEGFNLSVPEERTKVANPLAGAALGALLVGAGSAAGRGHKLRNLVAQMAHNGSNLQVAGPGISRAMGLRNMRLNRLATEGLRMQDTALAAGRPAAAVHKMLADWIAPEAGRTGLSGAVLGAGLGAGLGKAYKLAKQQRQRQQILTYAPPALAAMLGAAAMKD